MTTSSSVNTVALIAFPVFAALPAARDSSTKARSRYPRAYLSTGSHGGPFSIDGGLALAPFCTNNYSTCIATGRKPMKFRSNGVLEWPNSTEIFGTGRSHWKTKGDMDMAPRVGLEMQRDRKLQARRHGRGSWAASLTIGRPDRPAIEFTRRASDGLYDSGRLL